MPEQPLIFVSYSHKDEAWKNQLFPHLLMLQHLGTLIMWDDRQIGLGNDWFEEISEKLKRCSVAILLISANFLSSKFCLQEEVPPLLQRRKREGTLIAPILIRKCLWNRVPWLKPIQMLPRDGISIASQRPARRDDAFTEIAGAICDFLEQGRDHRLVPAESPWPKPEAVDLDRLPTSGYDLVGRDRELTLNDTWDEGKINIVSLVAWGGVGKSTLVNKWCEYLRAEHFRGARRAFGWSFFSQGANKPAASAEDLIAAALEFSAIPIRAPARRGPRVNGSQIWCVATKRC